MTTRFKQRLKVCHGLRYGSRLLADMSYRLLGLSDCLYAMVILRLHVCQLLSVIFLPIHQFLDRGIKRLEIISKLLRKVLVEINNNFLKSVDDGFGSRAREHLGKIFQLLFKLQCETFKSLRLLLRIPVNFNHHIQLLLPRLVNQGPSASKIPVVGPKQLQLRNSRAMLISGDCMAELFKAPWLGLTG